MVSINAFHLLSIGAILAAVMLLFNTHDAYALCCIPWNMNGYVDPNTGLFVGIGELMNDEPFHKPLANITFKFQFLDDDQNVIYEKEQSITHTLPISTGFIVQPLARLPFMVVLDDPELSKKVKYFTWEGNVHLARSEKWKPADLIVALDKIELAESYPNLGYNKWAIQGTIFNSHKKSVQHAYVVASVYDNSDKIIGVAGYTPNDEQPLELAALEKKKFTLYVTIPIALKPESVYLYAESEESSSKYPYYSPVRAEHLVNGRIDHSAVNLSVNTAARFRSDITNISRDELNFYWILKIAKLPETEDMVLHPMIASEGVTEHIAVVPVSVTGLNQTRIEYDWIPSSKGIYVYEVYLWSDLENPVPLTPWPFRMGFLYDTRIFVN